LLNLGGIIKIQKIIKKKTRYDIVEDYNINIKKIIENLLKRPTIKYNSLLISEEKKELINFV